MFGFDGPFKFDVDDEGTAIPWNKVSEPIQREISKGGQLTADNSKVYYFKIMAVAKHGHPPGNGYDWKEINRVSIETKVGTASMKIVGISPQSRRSSNLAQEPLPFDAAVEAEVNLFEAGKGSFRIKFGDLVSRFVRPNSYAVMASNNKKRAQWVYSKDWDKTDFEAFMYIVVPNKVKKSSRFVQVKIIPTRKGRVPAKIVSQALVDGHIVSFDA
jgi:hypothetical protein